ncbi:MAG: cytochrome c3 family protein [Candidatus Sumerlaeia bacterium]
MAVAAALLWGGAHHALAAGSKIVGSKHNLSITGPGPVRAASEERICVFCHTPHGGRSDAPLWNRRDSPAAYIPYDSPTLQARPGQPTGASKLCLSCHDGTIAMGDLISEAQAVAMIGSATMPPGPGLIGTDLRDDHPISFPYVDSLSGQNAGRLASPGSWDARVRLDSRGEVQCTTCHDPHDDQWGRFLVMDNQGALLCRQCHTLPFFPQTPHAVSNRTWNGAGRDPWPHTDYPDVQSNACANCHYSHHAGGRRWLVGDEREEEVCFVCHNGNVAPANLQGVFQKSYTHPVERFLGLHEDGERPEDAADHVECTDCHNPHRARRSPSGSVQAPNIPGVMEGVSGLDSGGAPVDEAVFEYQVCFKCHGPSAQPPLNVIPRQIVSTDVIREFSTSSPSYHPVEAPGRNPDVPSLIAGLTPASMIYCTDCHGNDGGGPLSGLNGPHGSNYEFMLKDQYQTGSSVSESPTAYALCYRCHSRTSILGNQSFDEHRRHIVNKRTPCSVCHDAHGIDFGQGNAVNNAHLVNFDVSVVQPDPRTGRLEYISTGPRSGQCYLRCHGENHSPERY